MPRRKPRRDNAPSRPLGGGGYQSSEDYRGEQFSVRAVTGQAAAKAYRCPGCDQLIAAGTPHVVAWAYDDLDAGDRRHWHRSCWTARERRNPGVQRTRGAPRY